MSTIQFPRNLCDQLDVVIKRFWWNPKSNSGSYLTPMAWSFICWPQKEGGLGLEIMGVQQALLSKIGWWILSGKDCPCVNILKAKYKVRRNWINHQTVGSPSMIWRSIESIKHLISHSACILVGNGTSIRIWEDPWIIDLPNFILRPKEWTNPDNVLWFLS